MKFDNLIKSIEYPIGLRITAMFDTLIIVLMKKGILTEKEVEELFSEEQLFKLCDEIKKGEEI